MGARGMRVWQYERWGTFATLPICRDFEAIVTHALEAANGVDAASIVVTYIWSFYTLVYICGDKSMMT